MIKKQKPNQHRGKHEQGYRIIAIAATLQNMNKGFIPSDVTGSYTGMTQTSEKPEQDADDL